MMEHYVIDALVEHVAEASDATSEVVNPAWKQEDAQVRSLRQQLHRRQAEYAAGELDGRLQTVDVQRYQQVQTELLGKLNATPCVYPGTHLTLHVTLVSSQMPRDQEV